MTNWHSTPQQAPSDASLLARLTEVTEDGEIWGPNASNVTTCVEDKSLYWKIRDAVHDQYRPRTAYQQILADRVAETIWRAERYASFETTALSFQISLNWKKFEDSPVKPTISAHDWFAWLSLEGPAYKALLEALKLEDRSWRRHRALCAELRTVQKTVHDEITPRKGPTPVPFTPDPADGRGPETERENEPNIALPPDIQETTAEGAATVTERISSNEPAGRQCSPNDNLPKRTQSPPTASSPIRTATERERGATNEPRGPEAHHHINPEPATHEDATTSPIHADADPPRRTQPPPAASSPIRTATERERGATNEPRGPEAHHHINPEPATHEDATTSPIHADADPPRRTQPPPTASSPIRTATHTEQGTTNEPQGPEAHHRTGPEPPARNEAPLQPANPGNPAKQTHGEPGPPRSHRVYPSRISHRATDPLRPSANAPHSGEASATIQRGARTRRTGDRSELDHRPSTSPFRPESRIVAGTAGSHSGPDGRRAKPEAKSRLGCRPPGPPKPLRPASAEPNHFSARVCRRVAAHVL